MLGARLRFFGLAVVFALAALLPEARAGTAVTFSVHADVPVRLQVAFSRFGTTPCDSSDNEMLYDGMLDPKAPVTLVLERGPFCVRHTLDDFPDSNWGRSNLWFRRMPSPLRLEAHVVQK